MTNQMDDVETVAPGVRGESEGLRERYEAGAYGDADTEPQPVVEPQPVEPQPEPEPWRGTAEFDEAVREQTELLLGQQLAEWQGAGAYEQYLSSLDPFEPDFPVRIAELAQLHVSEAVRPLLEERAIAEGESQISAAFDEFKDLSFDREAATRRAEEIFGEWKRTGAFRPDQQRDAALKAMRYAAEEVGRKKPTPPRVSAEDRAFLEQKPRNEAEAAHQFVLRHNYGLPQRSRKP